MKQIISLVIIGIFIISNMFPSTKTDNKKNNNILTTHGNIKSRCDKISNRCNDKYDDFYSHDECSSYFNNDYQVDECYQAIDCQNEAHTCRMQDMQDAWNESYENTRY